MTVGEIAARLNRPGRPSRAFLRLLVRDDRKTARQLAARCRARLAARQRERRRLRGLYREERRRVRAGQVVAGVDEVGRGPLAGPVVAAAVILPTDSPIAGLDDSKRLRREERERLDRVIRDRALAVAVGAATAQEIDRLNIVEATRLAMRRAVAGLAPSPHFLLIDGREGLPGGPAHAAIIRGDASCACIAAASIVAKVARDHVMAELDQAFPGYGFARHKGYATRGHLAALARYGPCPEHRRRFLHEQLLLFPIS